MNCDMLLFLREYKKRMQQNHKDSAALRTLESIAFDVSRITGTGIRMAWLTSCGESTAHQCQGAHSVRFLAGERFPGDSGHNVLPVSGVSWYGGHG